MCDYLEGYAEMFNKFGNFRNYGRYVTLMRKRTTWGDHLTLTAMAHLLMRPIVLITDRDSHHDYLREIAPPQSISKDAWGPPIWVVFHSERHYEATAPKQRAHVDESADVASES